MTFKTYIDAWFNSEKDRILTIFNDKVKDAKKEFEVKEKEFWTTVCEKIIKHMELNDIELSDAKPIYYNGYYSRVWTFADNGVIYKFRKEAVSSKDGYNRYKFVLSGSYPSDTDDNTVIGFEENYEADDQNERKFNSTYKNTVIDLIESIEDYTTEKCMGNYEINALKNLNKIIEKIKG